MREFLFERFERVLLSTSSKRLKSENGVTILDINDKNLSVDQTVRMARGAHLKKSNLLALVCVLSKNFLRGSYYEVALTRQSSDSSQLIKIINITVRHSINFF